MPRQMMDGDGGRLPAQAIEILRLKNGESRFIRTLDHNYRGCITHHVKKRSQYCIGPKCRQEWHKEPHIWKGYTPVEAWDEHWKVWVPWVLELTEKLDHTMKPFFARGQLWEISKSPAPQGQNPPLVGKFHEHLDGRSLPAPFSVLPILQAVFRVPVVELCTDNPIAVALRLPVSEDAPPSPLVEKAVQPATAEDWARLRAATRKNPILDAVAHRAAKNGKEVKPE